MTFNPGDRVRGYTATGTQLEGQVVRVGATALLLDCGKVISAAAAELVTSDAQLAIVPEPTPLPTPKPKARAKVSKSQCDHFNVTPGLDANYCRDCGTWFKEPWQVEADIARAQKRSKRKNKQTE